LAPAAQRSGCFLAIPNTLRLESSRCQIEVWQSPKWVVAGSALVLLALGIGIGRFTLPTKVIEHDRIVTSERDTELQWHAYVGQTTNKIQTKTQWQTITKWEKDGSVTHTQMAIQDKLEVTKIAVSQTEGAFKETDNVQDIEHTKIVETARLNWLIRGQVGVQIDNWKPTYGGSIERRLIGPVFAGVWGQASSLERDGADVGIGLTLLF
jgi:hypothetical protein